MMQVHLEQAAVGNVDAEDSWKSDRLSPHKFATSKKCPQQKWLPVFWHTLTLMHMHAHSHPPTYAYMCVCMRTYDKCTCTVETRQILFKPDNDKNTNLGKTVCLVMDK